MTRMVKLGDLLPKEAIVEVQDLIKAMGSNLKIGDLKVLMHKYKAELAAQEVDPDYLAYMLLYAIEHGVTS